MDIVSAFGPLKAYHFEVKEELGEPCAFLEVIQPASACTSIVLFLINALQ